MSESTSPVINGQCGRTAEELISELLVTLPAEKHCINLYAMMIGFLRDPETENLSHAEKDSINVTFATLSELLKSIMKEG